MNNIQKDEENLTKFVSTSDGSLTLHNEQYNQNYHSVYGAKSESELIFINYGLAHVNSSFNDINILEIGYGTTLNLFLTLCFSREKNIKINYTAIDNNPLNYEIINKIISSSNIDINADLIKIFIDSEQNKYVKLEKDFFVKKINSNFEDIILDDDYYNLVYFDPFDPVVQPEIWQDKVFAKIFNSMKKNSSLVTYSCKGIVKRSLIRTGFEIEKLNGPAGKREVLRANKI